MSPLGVAVQNDAGAPGQPWHLIIQEPCAHIRTPEKING